MKPHLSRNALIWRHPMTHPTARLTLAALATSAVLFVVVLALLEALSSAGVPW